MCVHENVWRAFKLAASGCQGLSLLLARSTVCVDADALFLNGAGFGTL